MTADRQLCAINSQLDLLRTALITAKAMSAKDALKKAHIQALETDIARLEQELRKHDPVALSRPP